MNQEERREKKENRNGKPAGPSRPERRREEEKKPRIRGKGPEKGGFQWRRISKTFAFWVFIVMIFIVASRFIGGTPQDEEVISYKEYLHLLETNRIREAIIIDTEFHGKLSEPEHTGGREYARFVVNVGIVDRDAIALWERQDVDLRFQERSTNWLGVMIQWLPWLALFGFWFFIFRQMQGGPKGVFSFGKSRAKLISEDNPKISFKDVAGVEEAKQELQEIIEFLKDPQKFQRLGGKIPKGVLLVGPPGTGKTYMAKAVAGEAGVPFFSISGSEFVEMFVGVGASRVRDLFEQGKSQAPCIIFVDEIDAVGRHRGAGIGGGHDEREQTLNQLLVEMDGFESNEGVILIAATNRPDVLDPALLRPGRFDRLVVVDRPDVRGREGILKIHTRKIRLARNVRMDVLARSTPGLSGADLANLANEAALLGSRRNHTRATMQDFEDAKDRVMMGVERRSLVISDEEKKLLSYHEIGHALVGKFTPSSDPVHKVTIIPRGQALGLTQYLPVDEKHTYPKSYCVAKLVHALGGRCAEKLVFHEVTTGSMDDYEQASRLARKMVCEWGMSDRLGPMTYGKKEEEIFLGREIAQHRDYSERTAQAIDEEVRKFIEEAEGRADTILRENEDKLHALAEALLELEVLDGDQIDHILAGEKVTKRRRTRRRRSPSKPKAAAAPKAPEPVLRREPKIPEEAP